jgi:hypothetical protein
MNDLKYQTAVKKLQAMRQTHVTLRINPEGKGHVYLYSLLAAYGYTWDGEDWQPFAGNPMVVNS